MKAGVGFDHIPLADFFFARCKRIRTNNKSYLKKSDYNENIQVEWTKDLVEINWPSQELGILFAVP